MQQPEIPTINQEPMAARSTSELVSELAKQSSELVKKQVELAQSELRADVKREIKAFLGFGVAGVCLFVTLNLLLVAAVLGLAEDLPGWQAALIVAATVLLVGALAGLIGWAKRVKTPLRATQKTLKEDAQWAKERLT